MPEFLSDEWIEAVKGIRDALRRTRPRRSPTSCKLNQVITGVPFGDGERRLHIDTTGGEMLMELGELEIPTLTITTDYDTAKKLFVDQDPAAAMQAFMSGKIKIQGDMTKLMAMQSAPGRRRRQAGRRGDQGHDDLGRRLRTSLLRPTGRHAASCGTGFRRMPPAVEHQR